MSAVYPSADYSQSRAHDVEHPIFLGCYWGRCIWCVPRLVRLVYSGQHFATVLINYTSPQIDCGRLTPPLPLAIQCTSFEEAREVFSLLQGIVSSLVPQPSHHQLLAAFNNATVRGLLKNGPGFYAVVIGSPPGIHRTSYVHEIFLCSTDIDI